jgi:ParB family transcriptional regulator, chromosome partitioning protein
MSDSKDRVVVSMPRRLDSLLGPNAARALEDAERPANVFGSSSSSKNPQPSSSELAQQGRPHQLSYIAVDSIGFSPYQTREISNKEELEGLAASIVSKGVLQPIIVRPANNALDSSLSYELVAGERRLRAAKLAGLDRVPAIVQELSNKEVVELAIIENAQREDLNPIEEAIAFRFLVDDFQMTHTQVAQVVGKNRVTITNALRLLGLDRRVVEFLRQEVLTAGHGRALLMLENSNVQYRFALRVIRQELSVRALETLVSRFLQKGEEEELSEEEEKELAALERQKTKIGSWLGIDCVALRQDDQGRKCLNLVFDTESSWKRFVAKIRE